MSATDATAVDPRPPPPRRSAGSSAPPRSVARGPAARSTAPCSVTVDLDRQLFGIEPNVAVLHQVVTAQLAAARSGTQSTKTRAEVRGGGAKPFRQKGTGGPVRARPARRTLGGGVALGPKPRSYRPAHAQEDDPAGPALGPVGPGLEGTGGGRRRLGLRRPEDQGRRGRPRRPRPRRPGAGRPGPDEEATPTARSATCPSPAIHGRRAQRLRHPLQRLVVFTDATLPGGGPRAKPRPPSPSRTDGQTAADAKAAADEPTARPATAGRRGRRERR